MHTYPANFACDPRKKEYTTQSLRGRMNRVDTLDAGSIHAVEPVLLVTKDTEINPSKV